MALDPIKLKNTLTGSKDTFIPLRSKEVSMYHCGPTVYDYAHIGNMRSYIFADVLRKMFEAHGHLVKQVINVTDVGQLVSDADTGEDKIEKSAREKNQTVQEITEKYLAAFIEDIRALHIRTHRTQFPHASEHIKEQIELIQKLEKKGYTYKTSDGIYFDTSKYPDYGKLGNIDIEHLKEGARIGINEEKKNITDFALWKFSPKGEKRLQEWPSPWGTGFPGWHIECSAMSMKYLGETFDIHTGGIDHIPVHHNNEIAQSVCATGKSYANVWMHNAFIRVDEQKMSKSLGNLILVADIIKKGIAPLALRYWFLGARYSTQMNFTWEALEDAENARTKLEKWFHNTSPKDANDMPGSLNEKYWHDFLNALADDLDTPKAIALVWEIIKDTSLPEADKKVTIAAINKTLSIINEHAKEFSPEVKALIEKREQARISKNWSESDKIRKELESQGVQVEDTKEGSKYS